MAVLDKARQRAHKIAKRVAEFDRSRALREIAVLLKTIQPNTQEMYELGLPGWSLNPVTNHHEPEPPKLKRSKKKLNYDGYADDEQMLIMLEEWTASHDSEALEFVEDTFGGDDTKPKYAWPTNVNFLAYAKEVGDFLANVTFNVDYLYIKDDISVMAEAKHNVNLWITLDPTRRDIVDVVVDYRTLTDDGYLA